MSGSVQRFWWLRTCSSWRSSLWPAASSTAPSKDETAVTGPRNSLQQHGTNCLDHNCKRLRRHAEPHCACSAANALNCSLSWP